ncbi:MAG TPA: helix-turn-helix domain-containing protein [Moheibacter sp.]|nr:helix-turn-helix domain-containing protein [Moheibacter sp.]
MILGRILFLFLLFSGFIGHSQSTESEKLLEQAEQIVHSDPDEAIKISDHIYKLGKNDNEKLKALYVKALSFYVKGRYDKVLENAFQSKDLAIKRKNKAYENKNKDLIVRVFRFLELNTLNLRVSEGWNERDAAFRAEDFLRKANQMKLQNQPDSAYYYAQLAHKEFKSSGNDWIIGRYFELMGDIYFSGKEMDSSLFYYNKAFDLAKKIDNPFALQELRQKLANSYLAIDSISKFQENTVLAEQLSSETTKIENEASNAAHKLLSRDLDDQFEVARGTYRFWFILILGFLAGAILLKLVFYFRNRNKLKMYHNLLAYLKRGEEPAKQPILNLTEKEDEVAPQKSSNLLKESEKQILHGLEKFEAGKKFTHKDMSLGMLAAQLNTNTKYLSEVINRQKEKNFNSYINELRINYITEKIKSDPGYLNYKVSYLAEECGFSSHSTFTTVFKTIVGISPIMFVNFVKEEMNKEKLEPVYE